MLSKSLTFSSILDLNTLCNLVIVLFVTVPATLAAKDFRIICNTISEETSLEENNILKSYDDTIVTIKPLFYIGEDKLITDLPLFNAFKCNELVVNFSEDKIIAGCIGTNMSGDIYPRMSKTVGLSRYTGKLRASLTNRNQDGVEFRYMYVGICEKTEKLF